MIRKQVRRFCGQPSIGPNGVDAQSYSRIRCPISPPPAKNSGIAVFASIQVLKLRLPHQNNGPLFWSGYSLKKSAKKNPLLPSGHPKKRKPPFWSGPFLLWDDGFSRY